MSESVWRTRAESSTMSTLTFFIASPAAARAESVLMMSRASTSPVSVLKMSLRPWLPPTFQAP